MIKDGYSEEADKLRHAKTEGKDWLAELEAERAGKDRNQEPEGQVQQGVRLLFRGDQLLQRIMVPDYFIRKQTLTNAERYTTDELKELEDMILGAEDKLFSLEYDLFCEVQRCRLPAK